MTSVLDRFNLRPAERRLVVAVALFVFALVNFLFVWPHFGDLARAQVNLSGAQKTLTRYQSEIALVPASKIKLRDLEGQGSAVLPADQELQLQRTVQTEVEKAHVAYTSLAVAPLNLTSGKTNQFFEERSVRLNVNTGDKELINFLVALGEGNSMIRVRSMQLKPDQTQTKLVGAFTLVASYQRKAPARSAAVEKAAPAPAPASAVKPLVRTNALAAKDQGKPAAPVKREAGKADVSPATKSPKIP